MKPRNKVSDKPQSEAVRKIDLSRGKNTSQPVARCVRSKERRIYSVPVHPAYPIFSCHLRRKSQALAGSRQP